MSITQVLNTIKTAVYGKDIKQAIHDGIEEINNIAKNAEGKATTAKDSAAASASAAAQSSSLAVQAKNQAEQFKNQAMSATPTGYEDLVNKVNSIYKETASNFTIIGTSEGSALAHTIYGMSKQDGVPTPENPVEIQSAVANFKCVGKNLLEFPQAYGYRPLDWTTKGVNYVVDNDGIITINCTNIEEESAFNLINSYIDAIHEYMQVGQKYRLGLDVISGTNPKLSDGRDGVYLGFVRFNEAGAATYGPTTLDASPVATGTADKLKFGVRLVVRKGTTLNNLKIKPYLELGTTLSKVPYKKTEVTTNLTLRAIEVSNSKAYNLVKDGKYYIADTVDWDEDKGYVLTRRINSVTFNGSESNWRIQDKGTVQQRFFSPVIPLGKYNDIKSNRFVFNMSGSDTPLWGWSYVTSDLNRIAIRDGEHNFNEIADLKSWLAEHPATFDYILATPIIEHITSEQAQALLSFKTYDEATNITAKSDIKPTMILEYSKDRNTALALTGHNITHKNTLKIAEVNTALIESLAE